MQTQTTNIKQNKVKAHRMRQPINANLNGQEPFPRKLRSYYCNNRHKKITLIGLERSAVLL